MKYNGLIPPIIVLYSSDIEYGIAIDTKMIEDDIVSHRGILRLKKLIFLNSHPI
jgi:hypothetical protein